VDKNGLDSAANTTALPGQTAKQPAKTRRLGAQKIDTLNFEEFEAESESHEDMAKFLPQTVVAAFEKEPDITKMSEQLMVQDLSERERNLKQMTKREPMEKRPARDYAPANDAHEKFKNAKAISSDEYFAAQGTDFETRTALNRFEGKQAISSSELFGESKPALASSSYIPDLYDVRDSVCTGMTRVAEKFSQLSNDVWSYINPNAGTEERKAIIKMVDMPEEMQNAAIECATQALEKFSIENDIAAYIKKGFDDKYNCTWHCVVGQDFGASVRGESKCFIYFGLGHVGVLLFKSGKRREFDASTLFT